MEQRLGALAGEIQAVNLKLETVVSKLSDIRDQTKSDLQDTRLWRAAIDARVARTEDRHKAEDAINQARNRLIVVAWTIVSFAIGGAGLKFLEFLGRNAPIIAAFTVLGASLALAAVI